MFSNLLFPRCCYFYHLPLSCFYPKHNDSVVPLPLFIMTSLSCISRSTSFRSSISSIFGSLRLSMIFFIHPSKLFSLDCCLSSMSKSRMAPIFRSAFTPAVGESERDYVSKNIFCSFQPPPPPSPPLVGDTVEYLSF